MPALHTHGGGLASVVTPNQVGAAPCSSALPSYRFSVALPARRDLTTGPVLAEYAAHGAPPARTASTGSAANNRGFRSALTTQPSQAAFHSNSARAAPMPRRKATLRATQCAVRCSGVPIAVLNCCSIRPAVAMNCSEVNRSDCPKNAGVVIEAAEIRAPDTARDDVVPGRGVEGDEGGAGLGHAEPPSMESCCCGG